MALGISPFSRDQT